MSQFFIGTNSGNLPPTVPTQFTADSGTATPAANNINFLSSQISTNNSNGITSIASGSTVTYELTNRFRQTTTTVDGASSTVTILSALPAGLYVFDIKGAAIATSGGPAGNGYTLVGAVRSDGASATLLPNQARDSFEETVNATFVMGVSGNDVTITVTGSLGFNFNWTISGDYMVGA